MNNYPYYIRKYLWHDGRYSAICDIFPGRIDLEFCKDHIFSSTVPAKKARRPGFFNPFSKNFLTYQEMVEDICWVEDTIIATVEYIQVDDYLIPECKIYFSNFADFKDNKRGVEVRYTLVIGGKEYDCAMLKSDIGNINMKLVNLLNEYLIDTFDKEKEQHV